MPARLKCPQCQAVIQIPDDQFDKPFQCTSCGRQLRVKGPAANAPAAAKSDPAPKTEKNEKKAEEPGFFSPILSDFLFDQDKKEKPSKRSRRDDDEDVDERARNDEDRPAKRRRRDDDDDDDDDDRTERRDRRSSGENRSGKYGAQKDKRPTNSKFLIVGLVAGALLIVGGGIGIYYAVKSPAKKSDTEVAKNNNSTEPEKKGPNEKKELDRKNLDKKPKDDIIPKTKDEEKKDLPKAKGLDQAQLAKIGRSATAFVEVSLVKGVASGTAFCIHPSGYFLTNNHVVRGARQIKLVLSPNTPNEKVFGVKVVRVDAVNDLAIVKIDQEVNGLEFLPLGNAAKVTELQQLVAFGFPFGDKLALDKGYPAVSVNSIQVSSLRDRNGELHRIQLDGALNPGHSGGPVLDKDGKVVGVVVSGIVGSGSAMAIPAAIVENFVQRPMISIVPPEISEKDRGKEVTITASLEILLPEPAPGAVELTLQIDKHSDKVDMERVGDLCRARVKIPDDAMIRRGAPVNCSVAYRRDGKVVASNGLLAIVRGDAVAVNPKKDPEPRKDPPVPDPIPKEKPNEQVVKLPDNYEAVCLGGNGRYVILTLARERKIAVLDTTENKIAKYLPAPEDKVLVAAGQDKLVVIGVENRTMQRWNLTTFEKELTLPLPVNAAPILALMGHASNGPLLVRSGGDFRGGGTTFIDIKTLKPVELTAEKNGFGSMNDGDIGRVSADGKTFGFWRRGTSPSGFITLVVAGSSVKSYYQHTSPGHITPNADGSTIHTAEGGFSVEGKALDARDENRLNRRYEFPAVDKGFFLVAEYDQIRARREGVPDALKLHMAANRKFLMTIQGIALPTGLNPWGREKIGYDQRILLLARQKKLVVLPETNDKVLVYDFDVEKALDQSGLDYLIVASDPVKVAAKGMLYRYPIQIKSKQGGVKISIDAGPMGMAVDKDNNIIWPVPENPSEDTVDVILSITDKTGQQELHSYKIAVKDKKDVPGAEPIPADLLAKLPKQDPKADPKVDPKMEMPPGKEQKLDQDKMEVKLAGSIDGLCIGGGGRYVILHLATERKLAVFDATVLKVVKYIPLTEDKICFAASRDKLVIAYPKANALQRWNLKTFEKEVTAAFPGKGELSLLLMGHDSDGPLFILSSAGDRNTAASYGFFNPRTFQLLPLKADGKDIGLGSGARGNVSANGKVFVLGGGVANEYKTASIQGTTVKFSGYQQDASVPSLSADGKTVYGSQGPRTVDGPPLSDKKMNGFDPFNQSFQVPSIQGNYYFDLEFASDRNDPLRGAKLSRASLLIAGQKTPLVILRDLDVTGPGLVVESPKLSLAQRILDLPNYGMLITIPDTNNALVLHKIDIDKLLEKSGIDYLLVASSPVTTAVKGKNYAYALQVKSKQGSVTFKLDSGPEGMAIDKDGKLTWKVPATFAEKQVDVLITVGDKSGQEIFHSFKVEIADK